MRSDVLDIVRILDKKTKRLEISTNGFFVDRVLAIAEEFPNITVRISIEGLPALNDQLRGIKNGFDRGLRLLLRLKEMGIRDIGFAMTVSGENCRDLLDIYHLAALLDVELANAVVHNSFYFHKADNTISNIEEAEEVMLKFMERLLTSPRMNIKRKIKDWFRAYLNAGLLMHVKGQQRPIECGAGTDTFFVDPWGKILACNGSEQPLVMGDLSVQEFDEIWNGARARFVRDEVSKCKRGCWMTGTAVPAMRRNIFKPTLWVIRNKIRVHKGLPILVGFENTPLQTTHMSMRRGARIH